jgi:hypothetical protein
VTAWARITLGASEPSLSLIVVTEEVRLTRHEAARWRRKTHVSSVVTVLIRLNGSLVKHIKDNGFGTSCVRGESAVALCLNASRGSFVEQDARIVSPAGGSNNPT